MTITSIETYKSAQKQNLMWVKATGTSVAGSVYNMIASAGVPVAAAIAGTNATSGIIPNNTTAGYLKFLLPTVNPRITNFSVIGQGASISLFSILYDVLWKAGTYAFNAAATLSAQPDISGRLPNVDYRGTELWWEVSTTFVGVPTFVITYTNQDGVTGRTITVSGASAQPVNQGRRAQLQEGDTGIQKVESVTGSVATAGAINLMILRPLCFGFMDCTGKKKTKSIIDYPPVQIYPTSALLPLFFCFSTSTGPMHMEVEVSDG